MGSTEINKILEKEYAKKYKRILYWPMKITGFARFDIKDNKIIEISFNTLVYRTVLLIIADLGVGYLLYTSVISRNYLKLPDGLCLAHFGFFANMLLINMSFVNRKSGLILISQSFRIDTHLGLDETKFMRDAGVKTFAWLSFFIAFANISGGVLLYKAYDVSVLIHFIGSIYFFWLSFCYDDYCFLLHCATFIALRAKYLNIALAKIGGVNVEYLSDRSVLNIFLWKEPYDELVTFQRRTNPEDFRKAFEMIFEMLRFTETFYKFPLGLAVWTIVMGTFVACQTFIERIKNPDQALDQGRTYIILGWAVLSWGFALIVSLFLDVFQQQIEQTQLICACVQLKPDRPPQIYKLTKTLLRLLERRISRFSIYNLFSYDTGFILRMAAATLVYITVQLQLAFPKLSST